MRDTPDSQFQHILDTTRADHATQQELLAMVDALLRPDGFDDMFDSCGADYRWMNDFKG